MSDPAGTSSLVALLERGVRTGARLHVPEQRAEPFTAAEVWAASGRAAARIGRSAGVGLVLSNTATSVAALFGALRSGATVLSVPPPPGRSAAALDAYRDFLHRVSDQIRIERLFVEPPVLDDLRERLAPLAVDDTADLLAPGPRLFAEGEEATVVQFSSGSTSAPKGVVLSAASIAANVDQILERTDPGPEEHVCSWLPLSHDMGLVGMLLAGWAAAGTGSLTLLSPGRFARDPASWLRALHDTGATRTAAPPSALDMAVRRAPRGISLRHLRSCIVGAEPILPVSLDAFAHRFADAGLDPRTLCPAYGLAEASLAVTMVSPGVGWRRVCDPAHDDPADPRLLVSCGEPLSGTTVAVDAPTGGVGEVRIGGPSLFDRYTDGTGPDVDGTFATRDIGFFDGGELVVRGRSDDVYVMRGRNLFASDVEAAAGRLRGVRRGRLAALDAGGELVVVAEVATGTDPAGLPPLADEIRAVVLAQVGIAPLVVLVKRGELPLTTSGKIRRRRALELFESGALTIRHPSSRRLARC